MKTISELKNLFEEINKLKNKASLNQSQFCSELTNSDEEEYLELHLNLLKQKKQYFQSYLKMYFGFRQNKEKVHHFLKAKIQNSTDEALKNDIDEILLDLGFYYSLDDYKQWIEDIKAGKRTDKMQFVWQIMKSPYVEYHYEVMKDPELDEDFRRSLRHRFEDHKEAGADFLLSKLDNDEDKDFQAEIIFILGCIEGKNKSRILEYARKFAESEDDYKRDRAIIKLAMGTIQDTLIFQNHLLNDTNIHCRAWSASAYMQMWFKNKSETVKTKAFEAFKIALENEQDYFVISVILTTIREMGNTKLGISQTALDELNIEKIDLAKPKAVRFLEKILKNN